MTQAKSPDVSEMTIRMDAISPEAEKELDELCWESSESSIATAARIAQSSEATVSEFKGWVTFECIACESPDPSALFRLHFSNSSLHREYRLEA